MKNTFSAYWLFYPLGLAFLLLNLNIAESTLLCVFYTFFVGTVWTLVPQMAGSISGSAGIVRDSTISIRDGPGSMAGGEVPEGLTWKHLIPPFILVMLMMFAVKLKLVMSTDVVIFTSMSLIHFRASILSFSRLPKRALPFSWIQLFLFFFGLAFLFQKNVLPFQISRIYFLGMMASLSALSVLFLFAVKRKLHEPSISQTSGS